MENVKFFSNGIVNLPVKEENGEIFFDAETSAIGLGISQTAKSGNEVVRWERVNRYLNVPTSGDDAIKRGDWISEPDFYTLAIKANNETAQKFQYWVTHDVLPSIRKHGAYLTDTEIEKVLTSPDTIIKLATQLKDERAQREELQVSNNQLKDRIVKDAPNVTFAKAVTASNHNISVGEMADILTQNGFSIGRNQLYQLLRMTKYLGTKGAIYNLPTSQMAKRGYFRVVHSVDKYGNAHSTTKVTPKGQKHLINKALRGSFDDAYQRVMVSTLAM